LVVLDFSLHFNRVFNYTATGVALVLDESCKMKDWVLVVLCWIVLLNFLQVCKEKWM